MFLRPERKAVHVNTLIRAPGVRLVRLHPREVGALTLREAVLAVKLELRSDDGVGAPAVHVEGGLGEHEGAGIRNARVLVVRGVIGNEAREGGRVERLSLSAQIGLGVRVGGSVPVSGEVSAVLDINSAGIVEEAIGINVRAAVRGNALGSAERVDSVGEGIDGIGVVEGLGSKNLEQKSVAREGRAIIDVLVRLDNPDKLLHGVVEVELNLVGGGPNGLVSSELELSDEVLVRVLGHAAALVGVKEDIIDVEGGGNEGLVVGNRGRGGASRGVILTRNAAVEAGNRPEALINGPDVKVNLDLVVLKSDEGERKSGVGAEPELKGDVKSGLRKGVTGSANLARSHGVARAINVGERGVGDEGKLGRVTNHLEVSLLLLRCHGELIPDVHPVSVLAVNALTSNLNLNLSNELLSREVQPAGINTAVGARGIVSNSHELVNLRERNLEIGAVSKISVPANNTLDTTTEIGLSVESLFDRLNREVSVPAVRHLPESNLRVTRKVNILSAVGD